MEHDWFVYMDNLTCCRKCGIVKRRDGKNRPCKGSVGVGLRKSPPAPPSRENG